MTAMDKKRSNKTLKAERGQKEETLRKRKRKTKNTTLPRNNDSKTLSSSTQPLTKDLHPNRLQTLHRTKIHQNQLKSDKKGPLARSDSNF